LNVTGITVLQALYCTNNQLTTLDLHTNTALRICYEITWLFHN